MLEGVLRYPGVGAGAAWALFEALKARYASGASAFEMDGYVSRWTSSLADFAISRASPFAPVDESGRRAGPGTHPPSPSSSSPSSSSSDGGDGDGDGDAAAAPAPASQQDRAPRQGTIARAKWALAELKRVEEASAGLVDAVTLDQVRGEKGGRLRWLRKSIAMVVWPQNFDSCMEWLREKQRAGRTGPVRAYSALVRAVDSRPSWERACAVADLLEGAHRVGQTRLWSSSKAARLWLAVRSYSRAWTAIRAAEKDYDERLAQTGGVPLAGDDEQLRFMYESVVLAILAPAPAVPGERRDSRADRRAEGEGSLESAESNRRQQPSYPSSASSPSSSPPSSSSSASSSAAAAEGVQDQRRESPEPLGLAQGVARRARRRNISLHQSVLSCLARAERAQGATPTYPYPSSSSSPSPSSPAPSEGAGGRERPAAAPVGRAASPRPRGAGGAGAGRRPYPPRPRYQ
eukprot:tig00021434_g21378.t1